MSRRCQPRRSALRRGLCGVLLGALLSACAAAPQPDAQSPDSATASATEPTPPKVTERSAPPRFVAPQRSRPAPQIDPARIVGLEPAALQRLLGDPWLKRDERPAQVWLYASGACAFHVFLYADAKSGRYVVRYFDAVPRDGIPVSRRDCFNALIRRQAIDPGTGA